MKEFVGPWGADPKRGVANFEPRVDPSMGTKSNGDSYKNEGQMKVFVSQGGLIPNAGSQILTLGKRRRGRRRRRRRVRKKLETS